MQISFILRSSWVSNHWQAQSNSGCSQLCTARLTVPGVDGLDGDTETLRQQGLKCSHRHLARWSHRKKISGTKPLSSCLWQPDITMTHDPKVSLKWCHVNFISFISFYDIVQISLESTNLRPRPAAQSPPVPSRHPQGPEKMPPAPAATSAAAHHDRPPWRHRTGQTVAAPPSVPWPSSGYATYKTKALDNQPKNRYITCYQHTNLHTMIDLCTFYDIVYVCLPVSVCVLYKLHMYACVSVRMCI